MNRHAFLAHAPACRPRPSPAQLYMITVPGLEVRWDWAAVHDRLLDDFPAISDVLATTIPATVLIVHEGPAEIDAWLAGIGEAILGRRLMARPTSPRSDQPSQQAKR